MKLMKLGVATAALSSLAFAAPAMAAPPYDVLVGGNSADADYPFTGTAAPIDFTAHGSVFDVEMDCAQSVATGTVHGGPGQSGANVATIANTTWTDCTGPLGLDMTVEHIGQWQLNVTDTTVTGPPAADAAVEGNISSVGAYVHATNDEAGCAFTVSGVADGHFDEVNQDLVVAEDGLGAGDTLTISVAGGGSTCSGLIADGDTASFGGTFGVATSGAIDITDGA
ncbi:hypothetical protein [Nocardioides sp. NPDC127503]|uniref:hypothetical protein n=1 Tax=Nocardioides sp. NPDC127503 TaxID=3154516 RepID=UPI00331DA88C